MLKKTLPLQLFLFLLTCQILLAQKLPDSLRNKSYDYLNQKIDTHEKDSIKLWVYLNAYLTKAKQENSSQNIIDCYENMAYLANGKSGLTYADSIIWYGKKNNYDKHVATGYITRGLLFYGWKQYKKALDSYLIANTYAEKTNDDYLRHMIKYSVASIKFYLGFYDESEALLKECTDYFKDNDAKGYINSLHALGLCYNKTGKYDLCTATNNLGITASLKTNTTDRDYFIHSEGINQYFKRNYKKAIQMIDKSLPAIIKNEDFANETVGYFYLGKSYLALNNKEVALNYFRKVDKAFVKNNYIRPDLRENYEILINHYKKEGDRKLQLHYIEKLLKADSILSLNFKYLSGKVHKEYDSHKLEQARNNLLKELDRRENTTYILYITVAALFFLTLFLLYRYYTNQRTYREKFEALMFKEEPTPEVITVTDTEKEETKKLDINPDVISSILKQLEKFENNKKFLQKDLTLVNLAANFGTNTNYLSKVISHYRGKNYISYLNDLRIDYVVDILKSDPKVRNYTIKALAEEAGFSTAQHFSKAFYTRTGIYPSYFVTELNRELTE